VNSEGKGAVRGLRSEGWVECTKKESFLLLQRQQYLAVLEGLLNAIESEVE
jgi:hypothetical protein